MEEYSAEYEICPECGYTVSEVIENALHMVPGTILHNKYIIGRVIGYGGFGVTYLAWDTVLRTKVAIKEYLPSEFSTRTLGQTQVTVFSGDKEKQFHDGMVKFIEEAKRLAKFRNEGGIVKVFDSFNENGTAYIVMEYLQGETLAKRLEREHTIPVEEAVQMLMPIIESLNCVHDAGIIHRDIAPDNIFITDNGQVKLIDFGAARYATASRSRSLTVIIKPGYSAEEQYRSRGDQGPHTDVYSIGACLYKMITGVTPPDAMERRAQFEKNHHDMLQPIKKYCKDINPNRANAIYNAMNVRITDRTADMISLAGELTSEEPVRRRRSGIKKIDLLHWPLWAKIGVPAGIATVVTLSVLLLFGVIGPRDDFGQYVPDGMTVVPDVVNITEEKAEVRLEKYDLTPIKGERLESDYYKRGLILAQEPDALNVVLPGTEVVMLLSDGFGDALIPDVVGSQKELAQTTIESAGFKVELIEVELGSKKYQKITETKYADGMICGQDPAAGEFRERVNTTVKLYVSVVKIGTENKIVPELAGKSFEEAKQLLLQAGLTVGEITYEYHENLEKDRVLSQNPVAGAALKENAGVNLTVNKGAEMVVVPDLWRKSVDTAQSELQRLGLKVRLKPEVTTEYEEGLVFRQSVEAGKAVPAGTTVTITYAQKKDAVSVPDVTGMTEAAATEKLRAAGFLVEVRSRTSSKQKGIVLSQTPADGTAAYKSTVQIVVSSGSQETKPPAADAEDSVNLISIAVGAQPVKTQYQIGETFSKNGMQIMASYSDGSTKDVTDRCSISQTGAFTKAGNQQIIVSYSEKEQTKSATIHVTVSAPNVTLDEKAVTLDVGQTRTIGARLEKSDESLTWISGNTAVAKVDANGRVTGVSAGSTVITASVTAYGTTVKDTCSVQVVDRVGATTDNSAAETEETPSIHITGKSYNSDQTTVTLTAQTTPSGQNVTWSVVSGNVQATTSASGSSCTFNGSGSGTVQASFTYQGKTYSETASVSLSGPFVLKSITASFDGSNELYIGDKPEDYRSRLRVSKILSNGSMERTETVPDSEYSIQPSVITDSTSSITVTTQGESVSVPVRTRTPYISNPSDVTITFNNVYNSDGSLNHEKSTKGSPQSAAVNCGDYAGKSGLEFKWDKVSGTSYFGIVSNRETVTVTPQNTVNDTYDQNSDPNSQQIKCTITRNGTHVADVYVTVHISINRTVVQAKTLVSIGFDPSGATSKVISSNTSIDNAEAKRRIESIYAFYSDGSYSVVNDFGVECDYASENNGVIVQIFDVNYDGKHITYRVESPYSVQIPN